MIGWIIGIVLALIIIIIIIRKLNTRQESEGYEHKSNFRKFLDACCLHRK